MIQLERDLRHRADRGLARGLILPTGLDFTSNDYLGLSREEKVRAKIKQFLHSSTPLGATGSRLLGGHQAVHAETEAFLAAFCGREATLLFPSGYQANLAVLSALASPDTDFFSDEKNHASLIDGLRLARHRPPQIYAHLDLGQLKKKLRSSKAKRKVVVTESVFSVDGDLAPLREISAVAAQFGAWLVVDEAHATGLYGRAGLSPEHFPLISIHPAGKALGAMGAFVTMPARVRDLLVHQARPFLYSTGLSPLLAVQIRAALEVIRAEPGRAKRCLENAAFLRRELGCSGSSPIIPFLVSGNQRALAAAESARRAGFDLRALRFPTVPAGQERLRLSVKSFHTRAELRSLARHLREHSRA